MGSKKKLESSVVNDFYTIRNELVGRSFTAKHRPHDIYPNSKWRFRVSDSGNPYSQNRVSTMLVQMPLVILVIAVF